jgi:flagellar hook-associated protein 2
MIQNDLRISGLASGMDTESIIKKLMNAERAPLNKISQNRKWNEWQRDAYRDMNTKLLDLRNTIQDLRLESTFARYKMSSSDSSKLDAIANGIPSQSSYTISYAKLYQPGTPSTVRFAQAAVANDTTVLGTGNNFQFTLNNQTIQINETDTIQSAIGKINAISMQTGVSASYSAGDRAIVFMSKDASTPIEVTGVPAGNGLGLSDGTVSFSQNTFGGGATGTQAQQASNGQVTINGVTLTLTSNDFTFDGISFTLKSDIALGSVVNIKKTTDVDSVFNKIKLFVDKYNETIKLLNAKVTEKRYRDFPPLLEEQKKEMNEQDIKLWEEKAKSGLLQNDSLISQSLTSMRNGLSSKVAGVNASLDTLSEIGISSSMNYRDNGILTIDEEKLKGYLQTNLDDVKALFSKTYSTGNFRDTTVTNSQKFENSGIAWRIYDQLNDSISRITQKAGSASATSANSYMDKVLKQFDEQIYSWEDRLKRKEDQYWKKFTAMERALQQANVQSGWLMQQLGGGQ